MSDDLKIGSDRIVFLALIVLLSIALPVGISGWSLISAMSGKPLGRPSNEDKDYYGDLHGGELWFSVLQFSDKHAPSDYIGKRRIKCLDLEKGVERETSVQFLSHTFSCVTEWHGIR